MAPNELSCQELVELVTAYLEQALPPEERARFDEHIAVCDGCSAYLDEMRTTIELTGRLEPELLGDEARNALLASFRDWKRG
jgi:anti-sigma factor RsiW